MNQPDPLAQLRDIHLPDMPGFWPPAPGWWILAAVVLMALTTAWWLRRRRRRQQAYRRQARLALKRAWAECLSSKDTNRYTHRLGQILRRTAIAAYPQHKVGSLTGSQWLQFLNASSPESIRGKFLEEPGNLLASLPYHPVDPQLDLAAIHELAMSWVNGHVKTLNPNHWEDINRAAV